MLDAAVEIFSQRGYHAASMEEIAARAGVSKPMVYLYLGSKEDLFVACLHREGTRLMEAIATVVAVDLPADEQLWRGLLAFFRFVAANRDGWSVLYRQARGREPFAAEANSMRCRLVDVVSGLLNRAVVTAGQSVRPQDLTIIANALVGAAESLADWLVDHPDEEPDATAMRMMNFVWVGAGHLLRGRTWKPCD